jgi:hypothetical protein
MGRPPKPIEEKLRNGWPSHSTKKPEPGSLTVLPPVDSTPEPARPLARPGREMWDRIWSSPAKAWLAKDVDTETVLILCEHIDERAALRAKVLRDGDWRERAGLRALDAQVMEGLRELGFNPVERSRLGVAEVKRVSAVEDLLARKTGRT